MLITSTSPSITIPETTITDYVLRHAERLAAKPALIDGPSGRTLTYAALADGIRRVATALARRGFKKGDVFAIYSPNLPEYAIVFLGVASLGGTVTTVNPLYTAGELAKQLQDCKARLLITVPAFLDKAKEAAAQSGIEDVYVFGTAHGARPFSELLNAPAEPPKVTIDPREDIVALPYSSGTTGLPKGVMLTHRNLVANLCQCQGMQNWECFGESDRVFAALPFFHIYGMVVIMMLGLANGATIVSMPRFDFQEFLETVQKYKLTVLPLVPPIVLGMVKSPAVDQFDLSSVRLVFSGAAPLGEDMARALSKKLGCPVTQGYGMTEASPVTHLSPTRNAAVKPGSAGCVVPNTEVQLVDPATGDPVGAPKKDGELLIRGPQIMKGYLGRPEDTAASIDREGWYHTGDVGYVDDDGWFFIVDRTKELIKYKGLQVAPAELEALLLTHPAVLDAAVVRRPDEEAGEIPKAFVVLKPDDASKATNADAIMAWVAERVAPHKRIRKLEFIAQIPKSASGKILRRLLTDTPGMTKFGIGQSIKRFEDIRLLKGGGRYQGDVTVPNEAYAVIVRSVHAHAKITRVDTKTALAARGVLGVFTGADVKDLGTMQMTLKRKRPDGGPMFSSPHRGLAQGRVRYVGDPIALVVAQTQAQAEDAAELVEVDYEPLKSVTDTAETVGGAPVWDECPDNVSNVFEAGTKAAADAAIAGAARVIKRRFVITRVHAQYMEPRGAMGVYDHREERYVLYADVQYPHRVRTALATNIFKVPEHQIRVIAGDVGGGFGTKGWQYPEHRLVLWAARKIGRPVRWTCERRESIPADEHARDNVTDAELALDADGKFIGLRVRTLANVGAYVSSDRNLLATFSNVGTLVGVYAIPAAHVEVLSVFSNTNPTAPYRGAGRPEATYVIERLIDDAARELGVDRVELRRKNLIPASAMPYKNPLGPTYDCGEFEKSMDMALKLADVAGFSARREEAKQRGKLRGLALTNPIEQAAGPQPEFAEVRFAPSGTATLFMGTKNQGQGHETIFRQILHEKLGIDPADVRYIDGDTDRVGFGMGSMGSRSTVIGGSAVTLAADKVIAKATKIAAKLMEAAEADITFADGKFSVVGTDKSVELKAVARAAFQPASLPPGVEPGLYETGTFVPKSATWPNGCHVCEVEVDPDTGRVDLVSYNVVDDVGTVINPITLKGQIHGGVAQGVGQALMEQVVYDPDSGQLLTATFMDYAMPRADDLPDMHVESNPVPTKLNPLGAKGAGEAGTVGALPVVINAVIDALVPLGVRTLEMPASPERVWRAIQEAKR